MATSLAHKLAPILLKPLTDKQFSIVHFFYHQYRFPNLRNPVTFNEKLQWLKLYYRSPLLTQCSDKLLVRDYVRSVLSDDLLVPLYGIFDRPEDIVYEDLPEQFVLKVTHGSSWNIFCLSKLTFDRESAAQTLSKWLQMNFYDVGREWSYREIKPRIICEQFISEDGLSSPPDYKIFCFHGGPKYIQVDYNRFTTHQRNFYDTDWNKLPCRKELPNDDTVHPPPAVLAELLSIARQLSAPFPFVRVDLYVLGKRIFFGELTFYPGNGVTRFFPRDYDYIFGNHLNLNKLHMNNYG